MGRMSEARKKAKQKTPKERSKPSPTFEDPFAEEATFPDEARPPEAGRRIALPSSGLAADILARADAAAVSSFLPQEEPRPLPEAPVARTQNISFFAAPVREERRAVEATEHLATFCLADEEYGVDVRMVQEIIRVSEITQVPRAPEFIKGVINLRGRVIPVVDLKRKLNLGEVLESRKARIVVVKVQDRLIGLLVDSASQVLKVPVSSIEAAPEEVVEIAAHYIRGVAKLEKRLIILVDLHRILSLELHEGSGAGPTV
jgi:purine-binding chemotaxis protein CheW